MDRVHVGGAQEYVPGVLASAGAPGHSKPLIEETRKEVTKRTHGRIISQDLFTLDKKN